MKSDNSPSTTTDSITNSLNFDSTGSKDSQFMETLKLEDCEFKKLTFEDWVNGNIPPIPKYLNRLEYYTKWPTMGKYENVSSVYLYWTHMHKPSLMDTEELRKINDEKRRIYYLAKNIVVNSRTYSFIEDILYLPQMEQQYMLKEEIKNFEGKLTNSLKRRVNRGEVSSVEQITPIEREEILDIKNSYDKGVRRFTYRQYDPNTGIPQDIEYITFDDLFDAHVNFGYLIELRKIEKIGLEKYLKGDSDNEEKPSSADKLSIAEEWMDPLIKEIGNLEAPVKVDDVIGLIEKEYPTIRTEYDFSKLKSPVASGGTITKKPIAEVLAFIYKKKHGKDVGWNAIYKRYSTSYRQYW